MNLVLCVHKYGVPLADPCCFPLGFMQISSILKRAGHDVKVLNYNLYDYDFDEEIDNADAVLFTGFEEFDLPNRECAARCRARGIRTILGGALATFRTDEQRSHFDALVVGEGDTAVFSALKEDGVHREGVRSLDGLPYPDYDGFGVEEYHRRNGVRHVGVLTSRGCPHHCTFCSHALRFKTRRLGEVAQEIGYYTRKYVPHAIVFNDNTLNVTKARFLAVCEMMRGRGLEWSAAIRVDNFDEECARKAKETGCTYFVVGVESLQQHRLDRMKKGITTHQIHETLDLLHKYKIGYHGNLILGLDDETEQDIFDELATDWRKYNLLPVMFQKFIGTCAKQSPYISAESRKMFSDAFRLHGAVKGKYMYPEVADAC